MVQLVSTGSGYVCKVGVEGVGFAGLWKGIGVGIGLVWLVSRVVLIWHIAVLVGMLFPNKAYMAMRSISGEEIDLVVYIRLVRWLYSAPNSMGCYFFEAYTTHSLHHETPTIQNRRLKITRPY